jgi:hypothetical protein
VLRGSVHAAVDLIRSYWYVKLRHRRGEDRGDVLLFAPPLSAVRQNSVHTVGSKNASLRAWGANGFRPVAFDLALATVTACKSNALALEPRLGILFRTVATRRSHLYVDVIRSPFRMCLITVVGDGARMLGGNK